MKVNNVSNQKFNGFSNVICQDSNKDDARCLFIAAKLDNEGGHNDLDEYRTFKKFYTNSERKIDDDVIVMFYNKISPREDYLFIGDEPLYWGEELKVLSENFPEEDYKIVEKSNLKAYTLMANLTKRMMKSVEQPDYKSISQAVINTCHNIFFALTNDFSASRAFVKDAIEGTLNNPERATKHCSKEMNRIINETMRAFF